MGPIQAINIDVRSGGHGLSAAKLMRLICARVGLAIQLGLDRANYLTTWLLVTVVPVAGLWVHEAFTFYSNYSGTCGLLDAGWPCTRVQYVKYSLMSVLVLPTLVLRSCTWLIVVTVLALSIRRYLNRRNHQSITI
jgi:hypothetical protein